jgi:hypothetical protein
MKPNTTLIAGVLILLFFIFITSKGQLPAYLAVLGIAPAKYLPVPVKTGVK